MLVLASTVVTVVIIVVAVVVVGILLMALGPLSKREELRDDLAADTGPFGRAGRLSERTEEEIAEAEGRVPEGDPEERLDRENE